MLKWLFKRADTTRDIPMALVRSAILGAILGPPFGLLFAFLRGDWNAMQSGTMVWLRSTMGIGLVFAVLFYIFCGVPFIYLRRSLHKFGSAGSWLVALTVCVLGGMTAGYLAPKVIEAIVGVKLAPDHAWNRVIVINTLIAVGMGVLFGNYRRFEMMREIRERELAAATARAEAFALQAQISPHFFFNALNSVSALVPTAPDAAQEMLGRLGDIFRYTFSCGRQETVLLSRELDFVQEYLLLEKVRYRDRLRFELPAHSDLGDVRLPGLSLQPIVENAIRYGISKRLDGGVVRVEIQPNDTWCAIHVSNQFDPLDGAPDLSEGRLFKPDHALHNVRERLWLLFGDRAKIEFTRSGPEWVRATITIPRNGALPRCG